MDRIKVMPDPLTFEWGAGNREKNWRKHHVSIQEAEEAFLDEKRLIANDRPHSHGDPVSRYILLGRTKAGRVLYIAFTSREHNIRVISARSIDRDADAEFDFWSQLDLTENFEPSDFHPVSFPNLKPTSESVTLRIPGYLLHRVKERAHAIGMPYQSLIKQMIAKGLEDR